MSNETTLYSTKKDEFLSQFDNKDTREVYSRIFKKSLILENKNNCDIYDFSEEMYEEFFKVFLKPKTKESARTYCNVLASYVQWAIDNNYSTHTTNPLRRRQDYFYNFVEDNKLYFSYDEKEVMLSFMYNSQDKFIIQALFEGIQGSQLCELVNLKATDLHQTKLVEAKDYEDYYALVRNKKGERKVPIQRETYILGKNANGENLYYKKNGAIDEFNNIKETVELDDSEYVLKGRSTKDKESGKKVSHYTVYNRLEMIKSLEEFEEFKEALTTKNIVRSGMIYWAKKILERDGILGKAQLEEVCAKFDVKYKWSMKDFLNEEIIEELYS